MIIWSVVSTNRELWLVNTGQYLLSKYMYISLLHVESMLLTSSMYTEVKYLVNWFSKQIDKIENYLILKVNIIIFLLQTVKNGDIFGIVLSNVLCKLWTFNNMTVILLLIFQDWFLEYAGWNATCSVTRVDYF